MAKKEEVKAEKKEENNAAVQTSDDATTNTVESNNSALSVNNESATAENAAIQTETTAPTEEKTTEQKLAKNPGFFDWFGLLMTSFILPGVLCYVFGKVFRKTGWIKDNDLLLEN